MLPPQTRHQVALKLANKLRDVDRERHIAILDEWRRTVDEITSALKKARRTYKERERVAKFKGRTSSRFSHPGLQGLQRSILHLFWDYLVEGATAGAGRELAVEDVPGLLDAFRGVEAAVLEAGRAARGVDLRLRLKGIPWVAVVLGYWHMRGSLGDSIGSIGSIDLVDVEGKEKPAIEIVVLALAELEHSNADIARGLDLDPALTRRLARSARVS